jgi:hypothetical protein
VFEPCVDAILVLAGAKIIACNEAAVRFGGFRGKADLLSRSPADMAPELQLDGRARLKSPRTNTLPPSVKANPVSNGPRGAPTAP